MPWREYVGRAHRLGRPGRGVELPEIWPAPPVGSVGGRVNGLGPAVWAIVSPRARAPGARAGRVTGLTELAPSWVREDDLKLIIC